MGLTDGVEGIAEGRANWTPGSFDAFTSIHIGTLEKALWLASLLAWVLAILTDGWVRWGFLFPAALLTVWLGAFFYSNNSKKWRRFYFRISLTYATVAGAHLGLSELNKTSFNPDSVWRAILNQVFADESAVDNFFLSRDRWREAFKVEPSLGKEVRADRLQEILTSEEPARKVITTKAYMIQQYFGATAFEELWIEAFKGRLQ